MKIRSGISLVCTKEDLNTYPELVRCVESAGFEMIGLSDSPARRPETYITGVLCAQNTTRVRFGPWVTNPLTRHPIITAAAVASLSELSGGRAVVGIGTGDSAAHTVGARPATLQLLEEYVQAVRRLSSGMEVTYQGKRLNMLWTTNHKVPIYVAAAGPRGLQVAGRIADGVIIGSGILPDVVEHSLAMIKEGAQEEGRDWRRLDLWWLCGCRIERDRTTAEERMLSLIATVINTNFQVSLRGKLLPDELREDVRYLVDHYKFDDPTNYRQGPSNVALLRSLPRLREYACRRFLVGGTPDDCVRQINAAREAGATQFWWMAPFADKMEFVKTFSASVSSKL